jgi:hypothetical protein
VFIISFNSLSLGAGTAGAMYLAEIAVSTSQSLVELNELITEARKTTEGINLLNEYTEKAQQEVLRARRIEQWANDLRELGDTRIEGIQDLNNAIRNLKDRRQTISELLLEADKKMLEDKLEDKISDKKKKQAEKREKQYELENMSGNKTLLGGVGRTADNTGNVAKETAIINQNLEEIKKNQNQIAELLRKMREDSLYSNSDINGNILTKEEKEKLRGKK